MGYVPAGLAPTSARPNRCSTRSGRRWTDTRPTAAFIASGDRRRRAQPYLEKPEEFGALLSKHCGWLRLKGIMPTAAANGIEIYYELHGPDGADVLVLSNGILMGTASWAIRHRSIAPLPLAAVRLPGMWRSEHPPGPTRWRCTPTTWRRCWTHW